MNLPPPTTTKTPSSNFFHEKKSLSAKKDEGIRKKRKKDPKVARKRNHPQNALPLSTIFNSSHLYPNKTTSSPRTMSKIAYTHPENCN